MTRKLLFVLGIIAVLVIGARPALAHHGGAAFDQTKQQTLQGTVTMLDFVNPHVVVWFDVANPDGTTTKWSGWLTAPNKLQRAGWTKHTLNPGDKVTITGNQQKNGSPVLQIRTVAGPDGKNLPPFEQ
jgi:hypothetical protein